jgi:putative hydrolase of the HAD superfamily
MVRSQLLDKEVRLNIDGKELLRNFEHKIETYPEVPNVLEQLKQKGFRLIILTNAQRMFVDLELNKAKIGNYFDHVFSSTSEFRMVKKTENLYKKVCNALRISPQEMIHIGDDLNFDFNVPRRLGIPAFHLDRTGKNKGELNLQFRRVKQKTEKVGRVEMRPHQSL